VSRGAGLLVSLPAPPAHLLVREARVLDPAGGLDVRLDVLVRAGTIAAIGQDLEPTPGVEVIDGSGRTLLPAFLDPHVHLRTPGAEDAEDLASGTAAAAAGGYGAILAMPNTEPVLDSAVLLRALQDRAAAEAVVPVGFLGAITAGQEGERLAELGALADAGAVGFSDDGHPVESSSVLRRALQYAGAVERVLSLHCEDLELSGGASAHEGAMAAVLGLRGYPSVSEASRVARDLRLAAYERQPLHLCHLHVAESVAEVRWAREQGLDVSAEASPHHLLLTEDELAELDPDRKMNPPLAASSDRDALVEGLRHGTLDCVATDHAPHTPSAKDVPFEEAPNGVIGLEVAFPALMEGLVAAGRISLDTLLTRMTEGPARAFGLPVPRIAVGAPAELALWDLDERWTVGIGDLRSKSRNCAFLGRTVQGRCLLTVARGAVAHRALPVAA
jgi:dihydroorotase